MENKPIPFREKTVKQAIAKAAESRQQFRRGRRGKCYGSRGDYQKSTTNNLATLKYYILKHIIVQRNILLAVQNSSVLENLACIAKIRFTLKSLLIRYRGGLFFFFTCNEMLYGH